MREIKYIVVHCSGTGQSATVDAIKRYWKEKMKWRNVGYHYIIDKDGKETQLSSIARVTNGVRNHNANAIHVCYIGGIDAKGKALDNRTDAQKTQLLARLKALKAMFPNAEIKGHRDFPNVAKACPSFDAIKEYQSL